MLNEIPQPLLQPRRLGDLSLPNRAVMAPLTPGRANNPGHVPNEGFDGVQLQAGFVYLIQQFLHKPMNRRTDEYGGSMENRARFLFEVLDAVLEVWPSERVGVKTGPMMNELGLFKAVESTLPTTEYVYEKLELSLPTGANVAPCDSPRCQTTNLKSSSWAQPARSVKALALPLACHHASKTGLGPEALAERSSRKHQKSNSP